MIEKFTTKFEIGSKVQAIKFAKECEQIADEYAIDFAEWLLKNYDGVKSVKELLEIYKQEI
jgi:hypothetical protein